MPQIRHRAIAAPKIDIFRLQDGDVNQVQQLAFTKMEHEVIPFHSKRWNCIVHAITN